MNNTSTGEAVLFWVLAPITVLAALAIVGSRKAVHSALWMAVVMVNLAMFFAVQAAPFLAVAQVVVYTGAVMMLFLFVLMLIGVDSSDSLVETLKGQRIAAMVAGLGFGILLIAGFANADVGGFVGLEAANNAQGGNVEGLAELIFTRYVFAFEVVGALLITAALGAMVLAHREQIGQKLTQKERSIQRFKEGGIVTQLPPPGVYARSNAVDMPALLPDGTPSELSVSTTLRDRGDVRAPNEVVTPEELLAGEDVDESRTARPLGRGGTE
ncbi:NADH-quinone oxidoreductase subunit J [Sporichthya brevicatena]|uniref:NADH-quinone oxidoreductase subunit J n=1 Tax=Sporichthya brevicatena TaxID=171442 RepID=A0ABN1H726_9ACTN